MKHLIAIILALCIAMPAVAQQGKPSCTDNSRACMIAAATAYLDAIVTHDASKVPFAANVKRTEQGRITGQGDVALRDSTKLQPDMAGHANTRFFVDEKTNNVIAYTLLRIPGTKADPSRKTYADKLPPQPSTVHLAERFKVEKGLITEIEALFTIEGGTMDGTSNWPD
jgi:3'(2'), 5'-bisphosphate nucleotidase